MKRITDKAIYQTLKTVFGFETFKGDQLKIIKTLLKGKDCFVIMPTGGGKSMCYQLPALMSDGTAIVISPLIALMKNQVDAIRTFGTDRGIAHFLNSSLNKAEIAEVRKDLVSGKTKLLYVAPESSPKRKTSISSRISIFPSMLSMRHTVYRSGATTSARYTAIFGKSSSRSGKMCL